MQVRVHVLVLTAALMPVRALVLVNMEVITADISLLLTVFRREIQTADITVVIKGDNLQTVPSFQDGINSKVKNLHLL
jgi:hypothetical protein